MFRGLAHQVSTFNLSRARTEEPRNSFRKRSLRDIFNLKDNSIVRTIRRIFKRANDRKIPTKWSDCPPAEPSWASNQNPNRNSYYQPLGENLCLEIVRLQNDLRTASTEILSLRVAFREERRSITTERAATSIEIQSLRDALERQRGCNTNSTNAFASLPDPSRINMTYDFTPHGPSNRHAGVPLAAGSSTLEIPRVSPRPESRVSDTSLANQDTNIATGYISAPTTQRRVHLCHLCLAHNTEDSASTTQKPDFHDDRNTNTERSSAPRLLFPDHQNSRLERSFTPMKDRYSPVNLQAWDILTNFVLEDEPTLRELYQAQCPSTMVYRRVPPLQRILVSE